MTTIDHRSKFTTNNWSNPVTVNVSALEDADMDDESATINLSASGGGYSDVATVEVTVTDDEGTGLPDAAAPNTTIGSVTSVDEDETPRCPFRRLSRVARTTH